MGPRSHERGNVPYRRFIHIVVELQWGRVLMNAETHGSGFEYRYRRLLQWGRVLMNAETLVSTRSTRSRVLGFNGAAFS